MSASEQLFFPSVTLPCLVPVRYIVITQVSSSKEQADLNRFVFFFSFWLPRAACKILVLDQGSNMFSLHWEHGVLTTGPSGKSLKFFLLREREFSCHSFSSKLAKMHRSNLNKSCKFHCHWGRRLVLFSPVISEILTH